MDLQLKGKVALVTGGSRGIGKAIAIQLAQEGADIVLAARTKDRLDAAAAEIAAKTGRKVIAIVVNTGDDASVQTMGEQALAAMGHVDILVNAAAEPGGYAPVPSLAEVKGAFVDEEINIKVKGYIRCAQAVVPSMKASGWGRIVNISGLAARQTGNIVGSLRNVAVSSLSKNLADELGPFGINVTCVHPGATFTERTLPAVEERAKRQNATPEELLKRMADNNSIKHLVTADEVAHLVTFLCSPSPSPSTATRLRRAAASRGPSTTRNGGSHGDHRPPTSKFVEVNGLRLHYLDWGNQGAPVIVCVHGLTSHAHAFDGFARRCADRFHVVALDVRGRGDSAWSPAGEYTMAAYTADLVAFTDALGLTRFTLVGTSMGGRISMHYAATHADRLERLVLNDIGPDSEAGSHRITAVGASRPASFASLDDAMAYRFRTVPAMANASAEVQRETARHALRQGPDGRWVWKHDPAIDQQRARDGAHGYPELWQVLASLPCPTLLLWGTISDVLSEAQARKIVATLPHGTLATVAGSAHAPTLNEPDAAVALEDFLSTPVAV